MKFTIFGSSGFIGTHLVAALKQNKIPCFTPSRTDETILQQSLGHVIYCIGITSDFRNRFEDTIEAHICKLKDILPKLTFDSFLYLSSTRVYSGCDRGTEDAILNVCPYNADNFYNISKLMGEAICLSMNHSFVRVVRLSNIYGDDWTSDNFLMAIIRDAVNWGRIDLETTLDSVKDYVWIDDVTKLLCQIATHGKHRLYNVASGVNVTNQELLVELQRVTGCMVSLKDHAAKITFPEVDISKINEEFDFKPEMVINRITYLVNSYKKFREAR